METLSALLSHCEENYRSPVDSPHKGQRRGVLMFSLISAWTKGWVNNIPQRANNIETLLRRHNEHDSVSNHQPHDCLLHRLFRRRSKKTSKPRVTGLCVGNSPGTGEFPAQMASNAENVSIWWRHHEAFPCMTTWFNRVRISELWYNTCTSQEVMYTIGILLVLYGPCPPRLTLLYSSGNTRHDIEDHTVLPPEQLAGCPSSVGKETQMHR